MTHNLTAWAGACAIALLLGICWDQPSDLQAMRDVSSAREDAIKERRRDLAIARMCIAERGPNSSWVETADGGYRCTDKRGKVGKQMVAEVK